MRMKEQLILGQWTADRIDTLLQESSALSGISSRIDFLSKQFLGAPYKESTLIGDADRAEIFVINLKGLDCFTFLDYIEALRVSSSFSGFRENLVKIRYQHGAISFEARNHFFTDWKVFNTEYVDDVTEGIAGGKGINIVKNLNEKDDASLFLPGVACREREIVYIPSERINNAVISRLLTADYTGIYADQKGLDVSHVGIFIRNEKGGFLRHASRVHGKVIDEDLNQYIHDKPGIIVLRPKALTGAGK